MYDAAQNKKWKKVEKKEQKQKAIGAPRAAEKSSDARVDARSCREEDIRGGRPAL